MTQVTGSGTAGADLEKGIFVKLDGSGDVVACTAGDRAIGVTTHAVDEGQTASFVMLGLVEVQVAAALAVGAETQSDANGRAIALDAGADCGHIKVGAPAPSSGNHAYAELVFVSQD